MKSKATLLEIREQILNHYYPELRAEEPTTQSLSLPVRPHRRPARAPAKSTSPQPRDKQHPLRNRGKRAIQPFSDIFLEDLEEDEDDDEQRTGQQPRMPSATMIDDDLDDDYEMMTISNDLIDESRW